MFNSFPKPAPDASGGRPSPLDWSAYTTVYDWTGTTVSTPATSYGTFLNISGEGYLLFARGDSGDAAPINPDVRITVDGIAYVFDGVNAGTTTQGNVLTSPIYYKSSLKIEVFNRDVSAAFLRCDYTYLSKISTPSKNQTLLNSTNRKMAYSTNVTTSNTDVVSITGAGYILAIEFSGFYTSAGTFIVGTVTVDSVIKMNDRNIFATAQEAAKQHVFIGPIRFQSNFKLQHHLVALGSTCVSKVWYTLD